MMKLLYLYVFSMAVITAAAGGKNESGALVVHTDDLHGWGIRSTCDDFFDWVPQDCEQLNTRTDKEEADPALIWLIAAFDPASSPGVRSIIFGHDHNLPAGWHNRWALCGPPYSVEHPEYGWPDDPSSAGNWVEFGSPIVGEHFFAFYRVAVWGFEGAYYGTGINPTRGYAAFQDEGDPPEWDHCDMFGQVRWYDRGYNECPETPVAAESVTWGRVRSTYR